MRDQRYEDALSWVNKIRNEKFNEGPLTELPAGTRSEADCCVIANALPGDPENKSVGQCNAIVWTEEDHLCLEFPAEVTKFIRAFDAGEYPELVA